METVCHNQLTFESLFPRRSSPILPVAESPRMPAVCYYGRLISGIAFPKRSPDAFRIPGRATRLNMIF